MKIVKMNVKKEVICRLCLKDGINEFEDIDEYMQQMFNILLLELDFNISKEPIICQECLGLATKCLNFKSSCINTEEIILLYSTSVEQVTYNIKAIYNDREHVVTVTDEDLNICRICMARLEKNNFVCIEALMNENMFKMLSQYIPEMDFNIIEDAVVCATCRENLQDYLKFTFNCLDTEEKIKAYCREEGTDNMGQVNLGKLPQFLFKCAFECPQKSVFKEEINTFETTENVYVEADSGFVKHEELDIRQVEINLKENSYESLSEMRFNKSNDMFLPMKCSTETKSNMISLKTREHSNKDGTYQKLLQAKIVEDRSIHDNILEVKRNNFDEESVLKNYTEICEEAVKPKEKNNINRPVLIQNDPLNFQGYLSVHKDFLEMRKYKCSLCVYESKLKSNLKRHMWVHKRSEIQMYKCSLCAYGSKYKNNLETHMLVHKDPSEIKMHKCSFCPYESKRKNYLEIHMLVHRDPSEIKMFKCSLCAYESKHKSGLEKHMLVHKDPSEIKIYKCSLCAFESKHKCNLAKHMLVHKDPSEIEMYKCSMCTYESKYKSSLKTHMLVHKDASEIKMHKCSLCTYEAKQKGSIKIHMLVHKDPSLVKMYKCSFCPYEVNQKGHLKRHMLLHKDPSETKMYKCSLCPYESKHKSNLATHTLVHKDPSKIKMYKCSMCPFESKQKGSIKRHNMLVHKALQK